jgi:hypothetical protein
MALKLRYFSHPDMLRQFEPGILIRIVRTAEGFFASKSFPLPPLNNGTRSITRHWLTSRRSG